MRTQMSRKKTSHCSQIKHLTPGERDTPLFFF